MFKSFRNRELEVECDFEVYRNLNNKCFSIKQKGLVVAHADNFIIHSVKTKISQKGRERVLKEKRKTVHAVLVSNNFEKVDKDSIDISKLDELYYEPYTLDSFINKRTGERLESIDSVYLTDGKAYILK